MSLKFERKLPIILFFVFLMLTTIGVLFYQNTVSQQEAINWQHRTQNVLLKLDDTLAQTLNIESAVNSFIAVSNETYLEPFLRAKPRISRNMADLRLLMADSPAQIEELDRLEPMLTDYVAESQRKVDLRKQSGSAYTVLVEVPKQSSRVLSEAIRASIDRIKFEELRRLQEKEQDLDSGLSWTIWILIISSGAGVIALALANVLVIFENRKRRSAEVALIEANHGLEEQVESRTEELRATNEQLHEIAAERESLLENEKAARQEAEIANRLRDEFMATVSHELRTPLNSILGWARMLKSGTLDDHHRTKAVTTIIKNSETQNRLIADLLDVARIISGKLEIELLPVTCGEIVTASVESVRPTADGKHISIEMDIADDAHDVEITGDRHRLMQVFTNLLTNAIKFSPEGSKIAVSVQQDGPNVEIAIADEGIGISEEFLPQVFERFRQDTSASRKNGGLGLGLAIVRNLVEMHGGSVKAYSEGENKGATFTVKLPVK